MVHLVPLGLALIVALVTILVVFFLSENNEQSKCKAMFLIYLFAIYEIFFFLILVFTCGIILLY